MIATFYLSLSLFPCPLSLLKVLRPDVAAKQRQRTKHRLTELPGIDTNRASEAIRKRLTIDRASHAVGESGQIDKADAEIDRHGSLAARGKRQTERKIDIRGAIVFKKQRALERAECKREWIWIGDLRPQAHAGTANRQPRSCTRHSNFRAMLRSLFEPRCLYQRRQPAQFRAPGQQHPRHGTCGDSAVHGDLRHGSCKSRPSNQPS